MVSIAARSAAFRRVKRALFSRLSAPPMLMSIMALAFAFAATPAHADEAAERFLGDILKNADDVFNAPSEASRLAAVETLVDQHVDLERISRFVLGQYARVMTDAQRTDYRPLFRAYATIVYQNTLSEYSGQRLAVESSVDRSPRDIIVNTRIVGAQPGDPFADLVVHWRVYRDKSGAMSIVDAGAAGVWLAIEQQSQFKSIIANNGGGVIGIDALIRDLRAKVGG